MLLLHVSDIHFRKGFAGSDIDPERLLRHELKLDVQTMCERLGAVDAILVSGDIAFAGDPEEFEFATRWLDELCIVSGAKSSEVFTCPGNHDAVRTIAGGPVVSALHDKIKRTENEYIDALLKQYLDDPASAKLLYSPLSNYNNFAAQFGCSVSAPDRLIATRDLYLNDSSILRLHGFNSALVSSANDKKDDLFVDPNCLQILREPGVEHLVMCHHPPEWLRNGQRLSDHLSDVAKVQLFGHEHLHRIRRDVDYLRIAAAATHPDRTEPGWEPGYNFLELSVRGAGADRWLSTKTHVRLWQSNPARFRAKVDRNEESVFSHEIKLPRWEGVEQDGAAQQPAPLPTTGGEAMASLREVNRRFFKLTVSQRAAIAGRLGLLQAEDADQPDYERYERVFMRARERELIEQLEMEVQVAEEQKSGG